MVTDSETPTLSRRSSHLPSPSPPAPADAPVLAGSLGSGAGAGAVVAVPLHSFQHICREGGHVQEVVVAVLGQPRARSVPSAPPSLIRAHPPWPRASCVFVLVAAFLLTRLLSLEQSQAGFRVATEVGAGSAQAGRACSAEQAAGTAGQAGDQNAVPPSW